MSVRDPADAWREVLARQPVSTDAHNRFRLPADTVADAVRLDVYPDGGLSRLHVYGELLPETLVGLVARWRGVDGGPALLQDGLVTLDEFNAADADTADDLLRACLDIESWVDEVESGRPYPTIDALHGQGERVVRADHLARGRRGVGPASADRREADAGQRARAAMVVVGAVRRTVLGRRRARRG